MYVYKHKLLHLLWCR